MVWTQHVQHARQDDLMDFIGSGKLTQLEDQVEGSNETDAVLDGCQLSQMD